MSSIRISIAAVALLSTGAVAKGSAKAATPSPEAVVRSLTGKCKMDSISDGVVFKCEAFVAVVADKAIASAALSDELLALVGSLGGPVKPSPTKLSVNGKMLPATQFETSPVVGTAPDRQVGALVAFTTVAPASRAVLCFSRKPSAESDKACTQLYSALATTGPAPFFAAAQSVKGPEFFGGKIELPEGCATIASDESSFRIDCPGSGSLYYAQLKNIETARALANNFVANLLQHGVAAPNRPCLLGGVSIDCRVVDDHEFTEYIGIATVQSHPVIAVCAQEPVRIDAHPLCAQVLSF